MEKSDKIVKYILFCVLALLLGFFAGAAVWALLRVMDFGIDLVWDTLPDVLECGHSILYYLAVCVTGGVLIGLWRKKYGPLPDNMEQVLGRVKTKGSYPYDRLPVIAVAALLPLIAGGTLGPEAGLSGIIAGLCCWIGDNLKYKGDKTVALAETGFIATVSVIFGAPFFGIAHSLEPDDGTETYRKRILKKRGRIVIYCFGAAGAMLAYKGLGKLTGVSGGIPRFNAAHAVGIDQWKWFVPMAAAGIVLALWYILTRSVMKKAACLFGEHDILRCVCAGVLLAAAGFFVPLGMFSGEQQLTGLVQYPQTYAVSILVVSAFMKIFLVNSCIELGWRGGNIFPMIFSGAMAGYAFAALTGADGAFAAAVVIAAFYSYIMRKPAAVTCILLLCFPVTYIIPVAVSAFVAAKIPAPGMGGKAGNGTSEPED